MSWETLDALGNLWRPIGWYLDFVRRLEERERARFDTREEYEAYAQAKYEELMRRRDSEIVAPWGPVRFDNRR